MNSNNEFALITGASLGIGREIAKELSGRNINTLLVALDTPDLKETENYISNNYSTRVYSLGIDLTDPSATGIIYDWCKTNHYNVKILINNAGFGESGCFENIPLERYWKMIELSNKVYVSLTHKFLPDMKRSEKGYIMNTSSMEARIPSPYKAVYAGTKHFIYGYSLALKGELRKYGIKVSVLCPGPVLTNGEVLERVNSQGGKAKMLLLKPDQVARIAVRNMLKGKPVINPGKMNWFLTQLSHFMPIGLKMKLLERIFKVYS